MTIQIVSVILVTFLGAFVQGMTGIGFAVIFVSICSFILPYMTSLVAMKLLGMLLTIPVLVKYRSKVRWKILFLPLLFSLGGNEIAFYILSVLNETMIKVVFGCVLFVTGIVNLLLKKDWHFNGDFVSGALVGIVVGIVGGMCGMSGPFLALYFLGIPQLVQDKDCYFATTETLFLLTGLYQLFSFGIEGKITSDAWKYFGVGLIPFICGVFLGVRVFDRIDVNRIKQMLNIFMIAIGAFMTVSNIIIL